MNLTLSIGVSFAHGPLFFAKACDGDFDVRFVGSYAPRILPLMIDDRKLPRALLR